MWEPLLKTDGTDTESVLKKRGMARCIRMTVYTAVASVAIYFCTMDREEAVYYPDKRQNNTTKNCYRMEEKLTFPSLFTTALGLFGVVVGTLVYPLSLLFEQCRHRHERYDGSWKKMIKACFSGILWSTVCAILFLTLIIVIILISLTDRPWFELSYLVYIFSGIGVGPLMMHLLKMNKVYIPIISEKKGVYVANGLAWSYYFNYLKKALPKFKDGIKIYDSPDNDIKLSLNKLLLLIPLDCHVVQDLNQIDNHIEKLTTIERKKGSFHFTVYQLTVNEEETKNLAIQYVEGPLKTLKYMKSIQPIKPMKRRFCDEEVKLLYRTLSEILADPADKDIKETCILVPIEAKNPESLQNGGLVKCIMEAVNRCRTSSMESVQAAPAPV